MSVILRCKSLCLTMRISSPYIRKGSIFPIPPLDPQFNSEPAI